MSWTERFVRHHKQQTDRAIHRAYTRLASDSAAVNMFDELLCTARQRAPRLMHAPVAYGHHPGVEALVHLARFGAAHLRPASTWPGTAASWRCAVSALAHHLVARFPVPFFLSAAWHTDGDEHADTLRGWFIAHAAGKRFRSLPLPIPMTRRMEQIFLASPDHLPIEHALRRAELLALGASLPIVEAVQATRVENDWTNGSFWHTVWTFLVRNAGEIDPTQIGPMIDFIEAVRHHRRVAEGPSGIVDLGPPNREFSMKGRTVSSMLRLVRDWHRSLGTHDIGMSWPQSSSQPMTITEPSEDAAMPPKVWHLTELTTSAQLVAEGTALHHCVASYARQCARGASRIWSLRFWRGERLSRVLTIEVHPHLRAIVQAHGRANREASGKPLEILRDWATRERLRMAI